MGQGHDLLPPSSSRDTCTHTFRAQCIAVQCLTYRHIKTGSGSEEYDVPMNKLQAMSTRDALAKSIYDRLFDWLVGRINSAMSHLENACLHISVLDIYGFEIFERNGFEQVIACAVVHSYVRGDYEYDCAGSVASSRGVGWFLYLCACV